MNRPKAPIQDFTRIDVSSLKVGEVNKMLKHGFALRLLPSLAIERIGGHVFLKKDVMR